MQDAMGRATTDVIMAVASFGLELHTLDFQHCETLDHMRYCVAEAFRYRFRV